MARSLFCGGWEQVPFLKSTDGWIIFTRLRYPILSNWIEFEVSKCVQLLYDPDLDPHVYIPIYIYMFILLYCMLIYVDIALYYTHSLSVHTCIINTYIHIGTHTYICMCTYIYMYIHIFTHTYIHTYIYIYMCPYWPTYSRWTAGTLTMPSQWCWNPSSRVRSIRSRGSWGRLPSIENGDL